MCKVVAAANVESESLDNTISISSLSFVGGWWWLDVDGVEIMIPPYLSSRQLFLPALSSTPTTKGSLGVTTDRYGHFRARTARNPKIESAY